MPREERPRPQRVDIEYDQAQREAQRPRIRLFPDIPILIAAILVLVLAFRLGLPGGAAVEIEDPTVGEDYIPMPQSLVVSEIMSVNSGAYASKDGKYPDWVEIYNGTSAVINLQGYGLSDNLEKLSKYVFPAYLLSPGEFVIVFCSGLDEDIPEDELHASFKLSSSGETVVLTDPHNNIVDQVECPPLGVDYVYARQGDAFAILDYYTPGFHNTREGYSAFLKTRYADSPCPVVINEIMTSNRITVADEDGDFSDWVELYNTSDFVVDLSGYALSNNLRKPKKWEFLNLTLQPHEHRVVFLSGKNRPDAAKELHATFSLSSYQDTLLFTDPQGNIVEHVELGELESDSSFGRIEGTSQWQVFTHATPGQPNTDAGYNAHQQATYAALTSPIVINEVLSGNSKTITDEAELYPDYIELYNRSGESVNLNGWALSDSTGNPMKWRFEDDLTLAPGEFLLLYADGQDTATGGEKKNYHLNFALSAAGESLILSNPEGLLMDRCKLPSLEFDMSYGRAPGEVIFSYMTDPTPGAANKQGYPGYSPKPAMTMPGGLYDGPQSIGISAHGAEGVKVYYTTDGSDPDESSTPYTSPVEFSETTVVRARSYVEGYLPSRITTSTYILDEMHTLPVVSIVADPDLLYSEEHGILVKGPNANPQYPYKGANFWQRWEIEAHLEYIDYGNYMALDQDFGLRVFGAYSRANDAKNVALFARARYGKKGFDYALFPEREETSFNAVILRNGASEWNMSKIRDVLCASLVRDTTDVDTQCYQPTVYYLNGKYQGVYFMQEKINEDYFLRNYGLPVENLNILEGNGHRSSYVVAGSNAEWMALMEYVESHDLSQKEHYDYVAQRVDIQNYMDYVISEIYIANTDTGNIKYWMSPDYDGKWRWIFYDVDWALLTQNTEWDSLSKYLGEKGHGVGSMFNNSLIKGLLQNSDFRDAFIRRFAYHMQYTFDPDRANARIDAIVAQIDSEMPADKELWGYGDYNTWQRHIGYVRTFLRKRPEYMRAHIQNYFSLSDDAMKEIFG